MNITSRPFNKLADNGKMQGGTKFTQGEDWFCSCRRSVATGLWNVWTRDRNDLCTFPTEAEAMDYARVLCVTKRLEA